MARTYNESKAVFLAGPIEFWWNTDEDPNRFESPHARWYRQHRDGLSTYFSTRGFLVYHPHRAFKGDWNEKMQPVNDYVLSLSDIVINMTPVDIPGMFAKGTDHEVELAKSLGKPVLHIPPAPLPKHSFYSGDKTVNPKLIEMLLETARIKGGW